MPIRIVHYPDPALTKIAEPIKEINKGIRELAESMIAKMNEHHGVGLAANQIGLPIRMFVAKISDGINSIDRIFINPRLIKRSGRVLGREGCLSLPGLTGDIPRASRLEIVAYNLNGDLIQQRLSGLNARIVQHENDHLDGKLITDYISDDPHVTTLLDQMAKNYIST